MANKAKQDMPCPKCGNHTVTNPDAKCTNPPQEQGIVNQ